MSLWEMALTRIELVLAGVALLGAAKSAYNGTVRGLVDNIRQIPQVAEKVGQMEDRQEKMVDGLIAVSVAQKDDEAEIDTREIANRLREGDSYRVFLSQRQQNIRHNVEEHEQGGRWSSDPEHDDD